MVDLLYRLLLTRPFLVALATVKHVSELHAVSSKVAF